MPNAKDNEQIFVQVKELIIKKLKPKNKEIQLGTRFVEDLDTDSLSLVEFILCLEETYNIQIPNSVTEAFEKVEDVVNYITEKVS